jgi:hypothetical protein
MEIYRSLLHPLHGIHGTDGMILGMCIADTYTTWVNASRPHGNQHARETLSPLQNLLRRAPHDHHR